METDALYLSHEHRFLLQNDPNNSSDSKASNLIGLTVLIVVGLLFMLNICLCLWKILNAEEENMDPSVVGGPRNRLPNINSRQVPVVFVNPGGSVRIGQKSKNNNSVLDSEATQGDSRMEGQADGGSQPRHGDFYYEFREVEIGQSSCEDLSAENAEPSIELHYLRSAQTHAS